MTEEWKPQKGDTGWYVTQYREDSGREKLREAVCTDVINGLPRWREKGTFNLTTNASRTPVEAYVTWLRAALGVLNDYTSNISNLLIDMEYTVQKIKETAEELEKYA